MTTKPTIDQRIEAVYECFQTAYQNNFPPGFNGYRCQLPTDAETSLIAAIGPHLGTIPTPAQLQEILSEVCELYRLDGRNFTENGREYIPGDEDYNRVLADREHAREQFIRHLIKQITE